MSREQDALGTIIETLRNTHISPPYRSWLLYLYLATAGVSPTAIPAFLARMENELSENPELSYLEAFAKTLASVFSELAGTDPPTYYKHFMEYDFKGAHLTWEIRERERYAEYRIQGIDERSATVQVMLRTSLELKGISDKIAKVLANICFRRDIESATLVDTVQELSRCRKSEYWILMFLHARYLDALSMSEAGRVAESFVDVFGTNGDVREHTEVLDLFALYRGYGYSREDARAKAQRYIAVYNAKKNMGYSRWYAHAYASRIVREHDKAYARHYAELVEQRIVNDDYAYASVYAELVLRGCDHGEANRRAKHFFHLVIDGDMDSNRACEKVHASTET